MDSYKIVLSPHIDDEVLGCGGILDENTFVIYCGSDESYKKDPWVKERPKKEDRMLELYHNQELCERFSANAYNIMKQHWNYNLYKKSLDKLFKYVASH